MGAKSKTGSVTKLEIPEHQVAFLYEIRRILMTNGWTKDGHATNPLGEVVSPCAPDSARFSMAGAAIRVCWEKLEAGSNSGPLAERLVAEIFGCDFSEIVRFNSDQISVGPVINLIDDRIGQLECEFIHADPPPRAPWDLR